MANILLTGNPHIMGFNSPRHSQHYLIKTTAINKLAKIWRPLEGLALWKYHPEKYDLIHSFNAIPITNQPLIITTESFLPRTLGTGGEVFKNILRQRLIRSNCHKIIAMSEYAIIKFKKQNEDWQFLANILEKTEIIFPNVPIRATQPKQYQPGTQLQVIFVGNHIARKGGIVALRTAKKALKIGLPIQFHIASRLVCGNDMYMDAKNPDRYQPDLELLKLENVTCHGFIKNQQVLELLSQSHIQLLASLDDTFGFSVIEGFAAATPAITTNVCALPEFVHHHENGFLLDLELNAYRNWIHRYGDDFRDWVSDAKRATDEYWQILDSTYEYLADLTLEYLQSLIDNPQLYGKLSTGALNQAVNHHNAVTTGKRLDCLYSQILT